MLRHGARTAARPLQQHARRWAATSAADPSAADAAPEAAAAPAAAAAPEPPQFLPLPPEQLARNAALVEQLRGQLILAPLTRGNHLPFRRLCADFGADVLLSEMAFARQAR